MQSSHSLISNAFEIYVQTHRPLGSPADTACLDTHEGMKLHMAKTP